MKHYLSNEDQFENNVSRLLVLLQNDPVIKEQIDKNHKISELIDLIDIYFVGK